MSQVPLDSITLRAGAHTDRREGVCLMEAAAWYAGERHTDAPACVCPVLAAFGRNLNDCLPDRERVRLLQYVPRVVGTAGDGHDQARGLMAADWFVRTFTPTWLSLAGLNEVATELRALPETLTWEDVRGAQATLTRARSAAESAARSAAESAAVSAAWSAAESAAWSAAWSAAESAARSAAMSAAMSAAWSAAESAAWSAAESAAWSVLAPVSATLRESAVGLFTRMIALGAADRQDYTRAMDEIVLAGTP